jgi:hypothetical protein
MAVEQGNQHNIKDSPSSLLDICPFIKWQDGAGIVCAIAFGVLAWLSIQPEFLSLWEFYALLAICFTATLAVFGFSGEQALTPFRIVFWALCFRVIGFLGDPLWEDDFFRYLWDGYRFYEAGTPYGIAPSEFFGDGTIPDKFRHLLARINYPNVPTIYGPTAEYSFLLGHLLAPAKVWPLQLFYIVVDLALIMILLRLASGGLTGNRWVLLYAWSPLVVKELAFTAHPDGLGAMLLMAALYCRYRQQFTLAVVALALSVGAKVFALLLVPFLLWRMSFRYWLLFVFMGLILYGPFIFRGSSDLAGLLVFAKEWQFNSSVYGVMLQWFEPLAVKLMLGAVFLIVYAQLFWRHCQNSIWTIPRGDIIFGVFFLIAPVVNAWYLLWLLPFAVLYPSAWSWTFSASVLLSYAIGINLDSSRYQPFELPLWVYIMEYGSVLVAVVVEYWYRKTGSKSLALI